LAISSTKKRIEAAFLDILSRKPFSCIKVKDIVDEADVSHMTFYRHFSDKYNLVECICFDDMMLFTRIYGHNAEWRAIAMCILNTIKNNTLFYSKILKDRDACSACMRSLRRVSSENTGMEGSSMTYMAWKETLQKWARNDFADSVETVYNCLVGAMPLHEVFNADEISAIMHSYESYTLDDFRNRNRCQI